jgi:uncharacterized protein YneR
MTTFYYTYKVTSNSKYYVGRHMTKNINDGYLGSGNWVLRLKDKSVLNKEILEYFNNFDDLKKAEEKLLLEHVGKEGCMNFSKFSSGFDSETAKNITMQQIKDGKNLFLDLKWQKEKAKKAKEKGTMICFTSETASNVATKRVKEGTHNFLDREAASKRAKKRVKAGTHPFFNLNKKYNKLEYQCPYCGVKGKGPRMKSCHFENCKYKELNLEVLWLEYESGISCYKMEKKYNIERHALLKIIRGISSCQYN